MAADRMLGAVSATHLFLCCSELLLKILMAGLQLLHVCRQLSLRFPLGNGCLHILNCRLGACSFT